MSRQPEENVMLSARDTSAHLYEQEKERGYEPRSFRVSVDHNLRLKADHNPRLGRWTVVQREQL